jgi:hypothetical protein
MAVFQSLRESLSPASPFLLLKSLRLLSVPWRPVLFSSAIMAIAPREFWRVFVWLVLLPVSVWCLPLELAVFLVAPLPILLSLSWSIASVVVRVSWFLFSELVLVLPFRPSSPSLRVLLWAWVLPLCFATHRLHRPVLARQLPLLWSIWSLVLLASSVQVLQQSLL